MTVLEALSEVIKSDMQTLEQHILSGEVKGIENFRFLRGQLWGLRVALDHINVLNHQIEESE